MSDVASIGVARAELIERKLVRDSWIIVVVALVIPFLGIWAAVNGVRLVAARNSHGWPLVVLGTTVFIARMILWFTGTWP